ncbi:Uncharacterised protein [Lysinibacillus capsici]|uniref:Uncharacterized protein n=1 Tax=Lysinibacillus capsici TaxID=2115968 RepID=A0A2X0XZJ3_9BACI|nr:Uncharacterised protein [Lysinibacillus capsici]
MAKTDKELTAEIVSTYVTSWNGNGKTSPVNFTELTDLIKSVHKTLRELPETNEK